VSSPERPGRNKGTSHTIHPDTVYSRDAAQAALGVPRSTLGREIRLGRLRVSKRAGRYFILGAWLMEWLKAGEVRRRRPAAEPPQVVNFGVA
jgi:hypothetical protein